jgi:hypothetical protein
MNTQHTKTFGTQKRDLGGKLIAGSTYIKKSERFQINNLMTQLKVSEKQYQTKNKTRWKEIIRIRVEEDPKWQLGHRHRLVSSRNQEPC